MDFLDLPEKTSQKFVVHQALEVPQETQENPDVQDSLDYLVPKVVILSSRKVYQAPQVFQGKSDLLELKVQKEKMENQESQEELENPVLQDSQDVMEHPESSDSQETPESLGLMPPTALVLPELLYTLSKHLNSFIFKNQFSSP